MSLCVDKICRTCMAESATLIPIWPTNKSVPNEEEPSSIIRMLRSFTTLHASKGDGLPEKVCITCMSELNRAFSFKQKCERSEYTLKIYLQQEVFSSEPLSDYQTSNPREDGARKVYKSITMDGIVQINNFEEETGQDLGGKDLIIFTQRDNDVEQIESIEQDQQEALEFEEEATETIYQCSNCSTGFFTNEDLNQHFLNDHKAFHCKICNLYFTSAAYESHKKLHDIKIESKKDNTVKYDCEICMVQFNNKQTFDMHCMKVHSIQEPIEEFIDDVTIDNDDGYENYEEIQSNAGDQPNIKDEMEDEKSETNAATSEDASVDGKFYCSICNAVFAKQLSLNIHFNSRKCLQASFECDICKRVFAKKKNLSSHMKTHRLPTEFTCAKCRVKFKEREQYLAHMKDQHAIAKKHKCNLCPKSFGMSSTLKDHLRTHSGERPFLCAICGKGFSQNTNLKQHLMRHNKTKPYKCTECEHSFVSKGELDTHLRKHTGDHPFVCDICSTGFTTSSSLVKHRRIHTGERPYACEYCPMRFTALGTLKNHRRTHTGERPFKCSYCSRTFAQRSDCVSHVRSHTGERRYSCTHCDLNFHTNAVYKAHLKTHQSISNTPPESSTK